MKNKKFAKKSQIISAKLLESIYLTDAARDIIEGEGKLDTILQIIRNNISIAFKEIENCRSNFNSHTI